MSMKYYFDELKIGWDHNHFLSMWEKSDNYKIMMNNKTVGILRTIKTQSLIYILDLHVEDKYRNKGIATYILKDLENNYSGKIRLKVFNQNPASNLYLRSGYEVIKKDLTHLFMEKSLHSVSD